MHHAGVREDDIALEIGPGLGSLTIPIAAAAQQVHAVEIDPFLIPLLRHNLEASTTTPVHIIEQDAREVEYATLTPPPTVVLGNLPYNIGTQLTLELLERVPTADRFLFTVQREVAERFVAVPRTKAYGAVTIKIAAFGTARMVMQIGANAFVPPPNVESAVVRIDRTHALTAAQRSQIWPLITSGFAHRRKTLRHSLAAVLESPVATCTAAGIDPSARAETLDLAAWCALGAAYEQEQHHVDG